MIKNIRSVNGVFLQNSSIIEQEKYDTRSDDANIKFVVGNYRIVCINHSLICVTRSGFCCWAKIIECKLYYFFLKDQFNANEH